MRCQVTRPSPSLRLRAMSQRGLTEVMVQELEQRWLELDLPAYRGWVMSQLQGGHEWYSLNQVSAFDAVGWHRELVERSWVRSNLGESNF